VRLTRAASLLLAGLVVLDLAAASLTVGVLQADPLQAAAASMRHAKVVIIVGPVGSVTDYYRGLADDAVHAARRLTDDVVTVYSPNATWPIVRRALQGASIVVYLGHGNGWPSPYSDVLKRSTQDGLGLNPAAGVDDSAHQYFGEAAIAKAIRLAPGAVVLLHHLCYASGAGEDGMPDPSLAVARQRVDNFGAGWLAAGASAVVAEGHFGPAYYVTGLLSGGISPEEIWRASPTFRGHVDVSASERTPGAQVFLDPDSEGSGYYRSLVTLPGAASPADGPGIPGSTGTSGSADAGSLVVPGAGPVTVDLRGPAAAGSAGSLVVTFDPLMEKYLPAGFQIGTRWTQIGVDGTVQVELDAVAAAEADATGTAATDPGTSPAADPSVAPVAVPAPDAPVTEPPSVDMVVAEAPGSLIATEKASGSGLRRAVDVSLPSVPGVYRLVPTLHDGDGIAYDAATQALVPALIVHVTGGIWVSYGAPEQVSATAGQPLTVSIRIANTGSQDWGARPVVDAVDPRSEPTDVLTRVVAHWLPLDDGAAEGLLSGSFAGSTPVVGAAPGSSEVVDLAAQAPEAPGRYLLVVDLVTADGLSLAAAGVPPALIRVAVTAVPAPDFEPEGEAR
jgi:hypothetical protein